MKLLLSNKDLTRLQNGETLNRGRFAIVGECEKKPLFTNSLGEKFFEGDMVYFVGKLTLRVLSQNINEIIFYKEDKATTEIMTKESAEKWIEEHTKKEIELVKGGIYIVNPKGDNPWLFRAKGGDLTFNVLCDNDNGDSCFIDYTQKLSFDFKLISLATEEEKAKLIKAEEEHGKFWSDEKKDFLKLEDVCYDFESLRDLFEIDNIRKIETLNRKFTIELNNNPKDKTVAIYDGVFTIWNNFIYNKKKVPVDKQTFITLLKNHK